MNLEKVFCAHIPDAVYLKSREQELVGWDDWVYHWGEQPHIDEYHVRNLYTSDMQGLVWGKLCDVDVENIIAKNRKFEVCRNLLFALCILLFVGSPF